MTWPSELVNWRFLDSDLDREGNSAPGISDWLLEHYVCLLPSPSNCVGEPGVHHREKVERLMAVVSDTSERSGLWVPGIVLQIAFIRVMTEKPLANRWDAPWHEIFRLFSCGRWRSKSESYSDSEGGSDMWCYIAKAQVNYLRSLEFDQYVCSIRHLPDSRGARTVPAFPGEKNLFDPRPYAPVYNTIVKHDKEMRDLSPFSLLEPRDPEPETPHSRTLSLSVRYASATCQIVDGLRSRFADPGNVRQKEREQRLKNRMLRYPVEGWLDGSVTVAIPDFLSALVDEIGGDVGGARLPDDFLFFKRWEGIDSTLPRDILHLPVLLINHQDDEFTALTNATKNAQRLACVSAATFLAVLGIKDFPVYRLATYGYTGVVSQAWYSEEDNCCYSMDGVTPRYRFNLCREDGVLCLINFLNKLEEHARELRQHFGRVRAELLERVRTEEGCAALSWTFHSQLTEYGLWEHPQQAIDVDSPELEVLESHNWSDYPNSAGFLQDD